MLLAATAGRRVLFVGGKGGVGKTSVSSALALNRAQAGARVLLVSTDPAHNLGHLWQRDLGDEPVRLCSFGTDAAGGWVDALEIDPQATVDRHLAAVGETMRHMLPERMQAQARRHLELAREAPGSHEAAVLERIAELVEFASERYDLIIFDTAPSGHTLRLMALPEQLGTWTESLLANRDRSERFSSAMQGLTSAKDADPTRSRDALLRQTLVRRRERFELLNAAILDPTRTGFVVVTIAEPMPVAETLELARSLRRLGIDVASVVVNRRSPEDAGALLAAKRGLEATQLDALREALPGISVAELPLLAGEMTGSDAVARLAQELT